MTPERSFFSNASKHSSQVLYKNSSYCIRCKLIRELINCFRDGFLRGNFHVYIAFSIPLFPPIHNHFPNILSLIRFTLILRTKAPLLYNPFNSFSPSPFSSTLLSDPIHILPSCYFNESSFMDLLLSTYPCFHIFFFSLSLSYPNS